MCVCVCVGVCVCACVGVCACACAWVGVCVCGGAIIFLMVNNLGNTVLNNNYFGEYF